MIEQEHTEPEVYELASKAFGKRPPRYLSLPIPCAFDMDVAHLVREYTRLDVEVRAEFSQLISRVEKGILLAFSERMANLALEAGLSQTILDGLIAIAIEGLDEDWRDVYPILALHQHSALMLSVNPVELFDQAAAYASSEFAAEHLRRFVTIERSLESMGYVREPQPKNGFYYRRTW